MRKLFLLISLAFTVYYGASLWAFTDVESMKVVGNYLPLALLVGMFIIGLIHIRFALGMAMALFLLFGNPALLNEVFVKVLHAPDSWAIFTKFPHAMESIILGLFSAWILIRFFGNPELDYEYNRANAVRSLHFPVFIFGLTAVLAALYAIVQYNNIFYPTFWAQVKGSLMAFPFGFFKGGGGLGALHSAILLLEGIAIYVIVTNEVRTARQVRVFMWLLLIGAVVVSCLGVVQLLGGLSRATYADGIAFYNREINSTFGDPNTLAVFLLAMLPISAAMIVRGKIVGVAGFVMGALLIVAIALSGTKLAIFVSVIFLVVVLVTVIARAVRRGSVWPLILTGLLVVAMLGVYVSAKVIHAKNAEAKWSKSVVKKVDGTASAFFKGKWDLKSLNERTNFKSGDWLTALNMVKPTPKDGADNLLCGVGYDKFRANYAKYRSRASARSRSAASNMFLQVFSETGLFGALALVLITVFAIAYGFGAAKQLEYPLYVKAIAWSLVMLVVGCMTENAFLHTQLQVVYWMLVGLCMVLASLATREGAVRGSAWLNALLLLLVLGAWAFIMYPKVLEQREEAHAISELAAKYKELYNLRDEDKLRESLQKTGDYNFNRKGPRRWSDKNALVMTEVSAPVLCCNLMCVHPDVSIDNPVKAVVSLDGETLQEVVFTDKGVKLVERDISEIPKLAPYLTEPQRVLVRITVDRTWVPAEAFPQYKDDTFDVGVGVERITWKKELSPPPPEPTEQERRDEIPPPPEPEEKAVKKPSPAPPTEKAERPSEPAKSPAAAQAKGAQAPEKSAVKPAHAK